MPLEWARARTYRHFDSPVNEAWALKVLNPAFVSKHIFLPLIHRTKAETRYKKCGETGKRTINTKLRPIKYASHRDACIMAYYAHCINQALEEYYAAEAIGDSVIAYRSLGRANYNFAAEVLAFAQANAPVTILAFDVTGFFDNLDHGLLKKRLKKLLGVSELTDDWYKVFSAITRFHFVDLAELKAHPLFGPRIREKNLKRIAGVEELKAECIIFHPNPELEKGYRRGIPQGTPISAAASNLYMMEFDMAAGKFCENVGALYRRYSDDILVVCKQDEASAIEAEIMQLIANEKLEIAPHKTEKTPYRQGTDIPPATKAAQYLGFTFDETGAAIRASSLARQWRKMRRAIRKAKKSAVWRFEAGYSGPVYTKKLYRQFSFITVNDGKTLRALRNFPSYGRRSAAAFGPDEKVSGQVRRFERAARVEITKIKA